MESHRTSDPRSARRSGAIALLLTCAMLFVATAARAEEPFRLRLVREPADVQAAAKGDACIRGQLYLVRTFSTGATGRGTWIADTLEPSAALPSGVHAGVAHDDAKTGWRIELPVAGGVLRAEPATASGANAKTILIGRRDAAAAAATTCDGTSDPLRDGIPILRRLRDAYASPGNERAIQVSIEP